MTLLPGISVSCQLTFKEVGHILLYNFLIIQLFNKFNYFFLYINCYFEGDLPRANPAWETAKAGKEITKPALRDQEGLKIIIIKFYNLFSLKTYLCVDSFFFL